MSKEFLSGLSENEKEEFWKIYEEERSKLSILPDIECDFEALDKALKIYFRK